MTRPFFSFHTLGYRRNPFGALTAEEWAAVAVPSPEVVAASEYSRSHLQLLGPMGSGKTTALRWLAARYAAQGVSACYEYLAEGERRFVTDLAGVGVFLLDEAQRLSWRERRRLVGVGENGRLRLILSSHEDLTPLFWRRGLPLETVWLTEELTLDHCRAVWQRRLDYFALPGRERVGLGETAVVYLYHTFGQNLREAEYFLYEVWQRQAEVGEITGEALAVIRNP
jgi:hypothetical protein